MLWSADEKTKPIPRNAGAIPPFCSRMITVMRLWTCINCRWHSLPRLIILTCVHMRSRDCWLSLVRTCANDTGQWEKPHCSNVLIVKPPNSKNSNTDCKPPFNPTFLDWCCKLVLLVLRLWLFSSDAKRTTHNSLCTNIFTSFRRFIQEVSEGFLSHWIRYL